MITKLDLYLLRSNLGLLAGLTGLSLSILLLERLIRLTEILTGSDNAALAAARMIANLVPHYLELALPGAFLIAVIISIDRLSRSGEIVAMMSTGVSLHRIVRPFLGLAAVLALISILISGFLQPLSRYNYRQILFELKQSSIVAAFQERKFVQFKDRVIWTDKVDFSGRDLGETFIIETDANGGRRFMTGRTGLLHENQSGAWVITLQDGMAGRLPATIRDGQGDRLRMGRVDWQLPLPDAAFRTRGMDERELTLPELMLRTYDSKDGKIDPVVAAADMHDRMSRAALLLILPLIGVVLGLNLGRVARSGGVAMGILLLLLVQKMLEFGLLKAERGVVPAWAGLWPIVIAIAIIAIVMFQRAANGHLALPSLWPWSWPGRKVADSAAPAASGGAQT
ncbi:MAG: LptF/LptG family permease [Paracoccaceae bacterium]|nr:LptF/LptG family permease [Paracoccaceae bacterium]